MWSRLSSSVGAFFGGGKQRGTSDEEALAVEVLKVLMLDTLMGWVHGDAGACHRADRWMSALAEHEEAAVLAFWRGRRWQDGRSTRTT